MGIQAKFFSAQFARRVRTNTLRIALLMSVVCSVCVINTASAVTWTAGEIVQAMQQAQANGQPFDKLLAEKVLDEMAKMGLQIIDGNLVYTTTIPATDTSLKVPADEISDRQKLIAFLLGGGIIGSEPGVCIMPIPVGSAMSVKSKEGDASAKFSNDGTSIDLRSNSNQVLLTFQISADVRAHSQVGMGWCGVAAWPYSCTQWIKNPACPPPVWVCDVCWECPPGCPKIFGKCTCPLVPVSCGNCRWEDVPCGLPDICAVPIPDPRIVEESWTDWAPVDVSGKLEGYVLLLLNYSFTISNSTVSVDANATLRGDVTTFPSVKIGNVIPDLRLIDVPVPPYAFTPVPHDPTWIVMQTLGANTNGLLLFLKVTGLENPIFNEYIIQRKFIQPQQDRLNEMFKNNFPMQLQLPTVPDFTNLDPDSQALLKLVLDYLYDHIDVLGEFALDVVKNNWTEVLYYILTDNQAALAQLFTYQALCPISQNLKANMPTTPIYSTASGSCVAIDPRDLGTGPFYATANCQTEIGFQAENFDGFCREAFTAQPNPYLGNAAAWPSMNIETDVLPPLPNVSSKWSLSSAAQLAVGVEPINNNHIPFMKRVNYRQVGGCALEMRVYKKNISATNLTPLLWIHGGSWTYRGTGFLGMESLISNYTEDNFVVFAPFYRLAGNKDGNQECRNATWQDIVADVEAALDWVRANAGTFGANTTKIPVTGQSAGAHLAGWLMTHRLDQVSRGLLVYPPTDLNDFIIRLQGVGGATFPPLSDSAGTPYDPSTAQDIVETYLQLPTGSARTLDLNNPPVYLSENSFAQKIGKGQSAYPPAFILHGTRDSLLTYSQSQVLCESYGGVVNVNWSAIPELRAIYPCGDRSQLHLFKEADHVFELCPFTNIPSACRAGSAASALLLSDSLQKGRRWLSGRNANGPETILWYNTRSGQVYAQTTDGTTITNGVGIWTEPDTAWSIVNKGDFDGDGVRDYAWRNSSTGQVYLMFMASPTAVRSGAVVWTEPDTNWKIVAAGDLNGDSKTDLIWWNSATGQVYGMLMNGASAPSGAIIWTEPDTNWKIVAAGDLNGDSKTDLIWWNSVTGQVFVMLMDGATVSSSAMIWTEPDIANWRIVGTGDLDGDGKADLIWRNRSTGMVFAMLMNGTAISSSGVPWTEPDSNWDIISIDNYTTDNKADLLWRNKTTGMVFLLPMNGIATASGGSVLWTEPDMSWRITGDTEWKNNAYGVGTVTVDNLPPSVSTNVLDVNVTTVSGNVISWTPKATNPNGNPLTCRIGTPPANGTVVINSNCSSGTYQSNFGFIGIDSFTYLANNGTADSNPSTVAVAVTEPPPSGPCLAQYPVSQFTQTGKDGSLTITFTGNITAHTNKAVNLCLGTTLNYTTTSTQGPVVCKVQNNTTRGSGMLKINDLLKCTDKPAGKDKVMFKVKSGLR